MDNISAERFPDENKRRSVPGLHPGLNDLIRVLGKQAHCASRTLILCEPHVPSKARRTNYHKHCSPKRRNSSDAVVRTSALWSPIRPEQYYYDCFNYSQYPERETDYQDIENKYNALKDKPLRYSPPVCDERRVRRSLEGSDVRKKRLTEHTVNRNKDILSETISFANESRPVLLTSSEEVSLKETPKIEASSSRQQNFKGSSRKIDKMNKEAVESASTSVSCSELIDIRNLIRKSDRENFERMQQLLLLMKELSAKDFCRATCDQVGERYDEMGDDTGKQRGEVTPSGEPVDENPTMKTSQVLADHVDESSDSEVPEKQEYLTDSSTTSVESSSGHSKGISSTKSKSSTNVCQSSSEESIEHEFIEHLHDGDEETSSESEDRPTESESSTQSFPKSEIAPEQSNLSQKIEVAGSTASSRDQRSAAQSSESVKSTKQPADTGVTEDEVLRPSGPDTGQKNLLLTVCDSPMTVHELVEVSNIITDIVVLETVNELIKNGKYSPPSRRLDGASRTVSPSMISEGTQESPFEVKDRGSPKSIMTDSQRERSIMKELKSVSLPRASTIESYKPSKALDVTSVTESVTSKTSRKSGVQPTASNTSGVSKVESMKSKVESMKFKASQGSRVDSVKLRVGEGSVQSKQSEVESIQPMLTEGSLRPKGSQMSRVESAKSKIDGEPGFESTKSKLGEGSKVGSMKLGIAEDLRPGSVKSKMSEASKTESARYGGVDDSIADSRKPRLSDEPRIESITSKQLGEGSKVVSMKSGIGENLRAGSTKSKTSEPIKTESPRYKGGEHFMTDSRKPRLPEDLRIESTRSKRGDESKTAPAMPSGESKQSMKLKSIEERIEPSRVSAGRLSDPEGRIGHRRTSSCSKHSRSPSPSAVEGSIKRDRGSHGSSRTSQAAAEKDRIRELALSSSVKSQKEGRGKVTSDVLKMPTIDSVCEREDSQLCADYETDCSILYFVRITENAFPPEKESYNAAGFMLKSAYDYTLPPRGKVNVKTDLVLELPPNSYGRIAARKCLAVNFGIDVGADVIDRDCRENVTILLFNHSDKPFSIKKGNKVAQLICESIHQAAAKEKCDLLNST